MRVLLDALARSGAVIPPAQPSQPASPNSPPANPVSSAYDSFVAGYLQARGTNGPSRIVFSGTSLKPSATPPSTLTITLGEVAKPSTGGVRVSGRTGSRDTRRVYISGTPGIVFADGSFEFRDVPPGRHLIASIGATRPFAAVVAVGDKNVEGIELKEAFLLPDDARFPKDPLPAGNYAPGTIVPPVRLSGTVVEEVSRKPITEGEIILRNGDATRTATLDSEGRFEFSPLLPGNYDLRLQIFGHGTVGPTVNIDDKDIN